MPKFREFIYGDGQTYGNPSRVLFNAEPISATALSHSKVQVTWTQPANSAEESYVGFRIVRNQEAFPETEEDGAIIYEFYTRSEELVPVNTIEDNSVTNVLSPLVSGRFVYYRAWILLDAAGEWVRAGDAYTLLPSRHISGTSPDTAYTVLEDGVLTDNNLGSQDLTTTHERFLEYIPRALISKGIGPLDEIEPYVSSVNETDPITDVHGNVNNSLLNTFLYGFSLTFDEMLNFAEFISPELSGKNTEPNILRLQSQQLGLSFDTAGVSKTQKRMVREALYTYRRKGTIAGLQAALESMTGYDVVLTESTNIMLSPQDSTFYQGTGFWVAGPGCTIAANGYNIATPTLEDEANAIDLQWCAKVTPSTTGTSISLGVTAPITRGIPVVAFSTYALSFYARTDFVGASIDVSAYWYDSEGKLLESSVDGWNFVTTDNWDTYLIDSLSAPARAKYLGLSLKFDSSDVHYLDMFQVAKVVGGNVPAYEEARGVNVFLNPSKTNYILDPSFENEGYGYTFTGTADYDIVTVTSGGIYDGPIGARPSLWKLQSELATTETFGFTTSNSVPSGKFYSFSFYAKADSEITGTIGTSVTDFTSVTIGTGWNRYSYTTYLEGNGSNVTLTPTVSLTNDEEDTIIVEFDCVQLEAAYSPTDYFDGSLTLAGGAWGGEIAESVSYFYPAPTSKLLRLTEELEDYLPFNTPYKVDMYMNDGIPVLPPKGIS